MAVCPQCGNEYQPMRSAKFCSAKCRTAAWHIAHPHTGPLVTCAQCGVEFQAERRSALYCSRSCEGKAYRRRAFEWKRRMMMKSRRG